MIVGIRKLSSGNWPWSDDGAKAREHGCPRSERPLLVRQPRSIVGALGLGLADYTGMELVWKLVLIWLGGTIIVSVGWIGIGVIGETFASGRQDRISSPAGRRFGKAEVAVYMAIATMYLFVISLPIFAVIWPFVTLYLIYAGCVGVLMLPGWIRQTFFR